MALDWSKLNLIFRKPNKRYPSIPTIDESTQSHTAALKQIKEGLEIGERRAGDIRDSFVRVGELEAIFDNLFSEDSGWPGFATRVETDEGIIKTKALNPDVGAYAYDRLRYYGLHAAGKGTRYYSVEIVDNTIILDCRKSNVFRVLLTASATFANPIDVIDGQVVNVIFKQNGTGGWALTMGSKVKVVGAVDSTANSYSLLSMQYNAYDDVWLGVFSTGFA